MARSGASQGGRKKKKKSTTTKRLTTTHYLKTALRDLTGGESMDNLQELMTIRDLIHADTAHGFSTTPYSIKVARAALYDDYKDWFKHSFPECIKQKLSCISKCLENPRPKHRFELKGLVDRLAAFLTFRVEFRPAHNETGKVKACTLRQWTSTLIDITMWHLYHKMGIKGDRLRDVMGGRKIDQGDGILKALERHTAFLIKDRRLSKQSDMDLDQDFGREEVGLMVDSLLSVSRTQWQAAAASNLSLTLILPCADGHRPQDRARSRLRFVSMPARRLPDWPAPRLLRGIIPSGRDCRRGLALQARLAHTRTHKGQSRPTRRRMVGTFRHGPFERLQRASQAIHPPLEPTPFRATRESRVRDCSICDCHPLLPWEASTCWRAALQDAGRVPLVSCASP